MAFHPSHNLHIETVDDGYLILIPGADEVNHLVGPQAAAFHLALDGTNHVPDALVTEMAGLIEADLVTTTDWSRRTNYAGYSVSKWNGTTLTTAITGLHEPTGLTFDSSDNLYIANKGSNSVSMWNGSTLTTAVPSGLGLSYPYDLVFA